MTGLAARSESVDGQAGFCPTSGYHSVLHQSRPSGVASGLVYAATSFGAVGRRQALCSNIVDQEF